MDRKGEKTKPLKTMSRKLTLLLCVLLAMLIVPSPALLLAQDVHENLNYQPPAAQCLQCHFAPLGENHPGGCLTCHNSDYTLKLCPPAGYPPDFDMTTACANYQTEVKESFTCNACHVNPGGHAAAHDRAFMPSADCTLCHQADLAGEHGSHGVGCNICHRSGDAAVKDAIERGRSGVAVYCADCHGVIDHQTHRNAYEPCADCSGCHPTYSGLGADIINGHSRKNVSCAACHTSSNPTIQAAINKGVSGSPVYCIDCHVAFGNHAQVHDQTTLTDPACGSCHVANAVTEHQGHGWHSIGCLPCHQNANPAVVDSIYRGMAGQAVPCSDCHLLTGNRAPIANAGPDQAVCRGLSAQFSGLASHDHDGTISSYQWDFGDGTPGGNGSAVSHTFASMGTYQVSLTITDNQGAADTDTCLVTVVSPVVQVEGVWTTDLADASKTTFKRGESIRYHVKFTTNGTFFTKAKGTARNRSGAYWLRRFAKQETITEGAHHWSWDRTVPLAATRGSTAKVKIVVKIFDKPLGTLLGTSSKTAFFSIAR